MRSLPRRHFLITAATATAAAVSGLARAQTPASEPIIDIHQHTNYSGRTDEQLIAHQRKMGVTQTILLPAGSAVQRPSTNDGRFNGLGGASVGGNEAALLISRHLPGKFYFGANEVTDL